MNTRLRNFWRKLRTALSDDLPAQPAQPPCNIIITDECWARLRKTGSERLPNGITIVYEQAKKAHYLGKGCYVERA